MAGDKEEEKKAVKTSYADRVRELAKAYETGWNYREDSQEAGSVLANVFLSLSVENEMRFSRIWEKQEREFLQLVPSLPEVKPYLTGAAAVLPDESLDGKLLPEETVFCISPDDQQLLYFAARQERLLSAAKLKQAFYETAGSVYRVYDSDKQETFDVPLFYPAGEELIKPEAVWKFKNLCNGRAQVCWTAEFIPLSNAYSDQSGIFDEDTAALGRYCTEEGNVEITVTGKELSYPVRLTEEDGKLFLEADTPGFAGILEDIIYEIRVVFQELRESADTARLAVCAGMRLTEPEQDWVPQICLTEGLMLTGSEIEPFSEYPDSQDCCYIGCDGAFARPCGEISISFEEGFRLEEALPEAKPPEYRKKMKKYGWMLPEDRIGEWRPEKTVWEYFNGTAWSPIPESGDWKTGCMTTERKVCWQMRLPEDMKACVAEGEEHFYLRLRLVKAQDAFSQYYRKYVPVLKNIEFRRPEQSYDEIRDEDIMENPGRYSSSGIMYFAFDRPLPAGIRFALAVADEEENTVCRGNWTVKPTQCAGTAQWYGCDGFWLILEEEEWKSNLFGLPDHLPMEDELLLRLVHLWNNPVRLEQIKMPEGEETAAAEAETASIPEGSVFLPGGGTDGIFGVALEDFYETGVSAAQPDTVSSARHFVTGGGRIVTAEDLKNLCMDRFDWLEEVHCELTQENNPAVLRVVLLGSPKGGRESIRQEMQEWLKNCLEEEGCFWLAQYRIEVFFSGQGHSADSHSGG